MLGSRGQVGQELIRATWPINTPVVGLSRQQLDIIDPAAIEAALEHYRPDIVVNAAAYTAVDRAQGEQREARAVNAIAPGHIASACERRGSRIIHLSTDYVFDGCANQPYREDDPTNPINVYGETKLGGEAAVRAGQQQHIIVRTSWVYAAHGTNFVKTMLRLAKERDRISVVADQVGAPTSAADIASAIVHIARRAIEEPSNRDYTGTFHFTADGYTTWYGLAEEVLEFQRGQTGSRPLLVPVTTAEFPVGAARPPYSRLDCGLIDRVFQVRRPHWRSSLEIVLNQLHTHNGNLKTSRANNDP